MYNTANMRMKVAVRAKSAQESKLCHNLKEYVWTNMPNIRFCISSDYLSAVCVCTGSNQVKTTLISIFLTMITSTVKKNASEKVYFQRLVWSGKSVVSRSCTWFGDQPPQRVLKECFPNSFSWCQFRMRVLWWAISHNVTDVCFVIDRGNVASK